jgi:hypothetical protein
MTGARPAEHVSVIGRAESEWCISSRPPAVRSLESGISGPFAALAQLSAGIFFAVQSPEATTATRAEPPDHIAFIASCKAMLYPTQAEILANEPLDEWIDEHFLRFDPFAFQACGFRPIITVIARELRVDPNGVFCIGSGAVGLSLNPGKIQRKALKPFDATSDLDFAVVSEVHFEQAWRDLREATRPTLTAVDQQLRDNLTWLKKRFFDGAILAHVLLPYLSFGNSWISAIVKVQQDVALALDREVAIKTWIYRDYWSLRNYVAASIVTCRGRIV